MAQLRVEGRPLKPRVWWKERTAKFGAGRAVFVLLSVLLIVPCYWQPRLQAGDLSSHLYNAWLAQLIENGQVQGLAIARQTTNVLFDLLLSGLFRTVGPEAAQRLAISLAVLVFVWGAFSFVSKVAGRRAWHLLPSIAMLAYGWVFHMGFFNFYLSMGLGFWVLALAWEWKRGGMLAAAPLFVLCYVAHALPAVWTGGLLLFLWLAHRVPAERRSLVTGAFLLVMATMHVVLGRTLVTRWSPRQVAMSTGMDQVWVFDNKYYLVLAGLALVWGLFFLDLLKRSGLRQVVFGVPFQICLISASAVSLLPNMVLIPGFHHGLVYIAERMSLGVGISVCGLLGAVRPRAVANYAMVLVAGMFFMFLYRDERALNAFEDRMQNVVSQMAPGQRVIGAIDDPQLHVIAVPHVIDRVCIGRCFSYANYEPSTAQFRVRSQGPNPYVMSDYEDSLQAQLGRYKVRTDDLPLYSVGLDGHGRMVIRELQAGMICFTKHYDVLAASPRS